MSNSKYTLSAVLSSAYAAAKEKFETSPEHAKVHSEGRGKRVAYIDFYVSNSEVVAFETYKNGIVRMLSFLPDIENCKGKLVWHAVVRQYDLTSLAGMRHAGSNMLFALLKASDSRILEQIGEENSGETKPKEPKKEKSVDKYTLLFVQNLPDDVLDEVSTEVEIGCDHTAHIISNINPEAESISIYIVNGSTKDEILAGSVSSEDFSKLRINPEAAVGGVMSTKTPKIKMFFSDKSYKLLK